MKTDTEDETTQEAKRSNNLSGFNLRINFQVKMIFKCFLVVLIALSE